MNLKICGLKYPDNIKQVSEQNPEFMGFIFYEGSKRFVGEDFEMPEISSDIKKVGVFVDSTENYIMEKVQKYELDLVQLHGNESPDFCEKISGKIKIIKAFGLEDNFDLSILNDYKTFCSYFLFDSKSENYGGSGNPFNWNTLLKYECPVPYFIAGGMDLEKFRKLQELNLNFYGIDVNSRIEIKSGYKDVIKVIQIKNCIR